MKKGTKKVKDNGEMTYLVPTREEFSKWFASPEDFANEITNLERLVEQQLVQHQLSSRFRTDVAITKDTEKSETERSAASNRIKGIYAHDFSTLGTTRVSKWGELKPYVEIAKAQLKAANKEITDENVRKVAEKVKLAVMGM